MPVAKYLAQPAQEISRTAARDLMHRVLTDAHLPDSTIAGLLTALAARPVTANELAGFADAIRELAVPLDFTAQERATLVDTCGTGGDNSGTFNISTGAALVAAAAGAKIAKHGNRSITSRCGSADVLESLGVPVTLSPAQSVACLRHTGFCFLYAPALHPALKRVQPIRRTLGFRTVFNLLGPLTNPAYAAAQVMGVYAPELVPISAEALALLDVRRAIVLHGADGVDELTLHGPSHIAKIFSETIPGRKITVRQITAAEAGLPAAPLAALIGGGAAANAGILRAIFDGAPGAHRDIVLLNAAAALLVAGLASSLREGAAKAAAAIDTGAATKLLASLNHFRASLQ